MGPDNWGEAPKRRSIYDGMFPSTEEMQRAWAYFWSQNRLSIDEHGRKYRTNDPRVMPLPREFEFKRKDKKYGEDYYQAGR
jgi:hypothetical protein